MTDIDTLLEEGPHTHIAASAAEVFAERHGLTRPLAMLDTSQGCKEVTRLLGSIEHGLPV